MSPRPKSSESLPAASLLSRFTEHVLKLKRIFSAVENAPGDVKQVVEGLDVITALLVEDDGPRSQPYHTAASAAIWNGCVFPCKHAGKASEDVTKELKKNVKINRALGGICVAFEQEIIAELK